MRLRKRWWLYCAVGFVAGHGLFGLIGHGFTGPHEGDPAGLQILAHTIGLFIMGLVVFALQRIALQPWLAISTTCVMLATLAFVAAFQLGAWTLRPPFDYIFGWPVLGTAVWISMRHFRGSMALWAGAAIGSFWLGLVVLVIAVEPLIVSGAWELDSSSLFDHTLMWVVGGGATAVVGGFVSGWPLSRLLLQSTDGGAT